MPGYALLPTIDSPVSHTTFRLTNEEMKTRNEWIIEQDKNGMSHEEIAKEVGLSKQRVYQIIGPKNPTGPRGYCRNKAVVAPKKFNTPAEVALDEYLRLDLIPSCFQGCDGTCMTCQSYMGMRGMDFDADGWPIYEGDRQYIQPHMIRPNATRWDVYWTFYRDWNDRGEEHTIRFDDEDDANAFCSLMKNVLGAQHLDHYWANVSKVRYAK